MPVSVVIPLHDKRPFIRRALASVLAQRPSPAEVIVVDDGSTDGGGQEIALADPRVRLVTQAQSGPGGARNRGVREAGCEWIAFLDADDSWDPGWLEATTRALSTFPSSACAFTNYRESRSGRAVLRQVPEEPKAVEDYFAFALANDGHAMWSSALLARRATLAACGPFAELVLAGEDMDMWARLAWHSEVVFVPAVLATYHVDVPQSLTKLRSRLEAPEPPLLSTYLAWRRSHRIPTQLLASSRRFVSRIVTDYACESAVLGRKREALRLLLRAARGGTLTARDALRGLFCQATPVGVRLARRGLMRTGSTGPRRVER